MNGTDAPDAGVLPVGRTAGVCLHITSLPGRYGIGDIGDAAQAFVDSLAAMQMRVWQILPTGPTDKGHSPYQPLSTFAGNEMLLDLMPLQRAGLLAAAEIAPLARLPRARVDYRRLLDVKPALLAQAAARFHERADATQKAVRERFIAQHDSRWLHDYALFRVLRAAHQEMPWPAWQRSLAAREPAALKRIETRQCGAIETIKTLQWWFHEQWTALQRHAAARGVLLLGDLPIYVSADGADAWARRDLFQVDARGLPQRIAGVPPDYFSEYGQLWGNPVYNWSRHREQSYAWWTARLGHAIAGTDLLRIDHFRGFEAYWSVPAGADSARDGRWDAGPGSELFDALSRALGPLPIVAENLGHITPEVEALRSRYGWPGMRVLQFEITGEPFEWQSLDENTVCYTGTHDNNTVLGWFHDGDDSAADDRAARQARILRHTGGTAHTVHNDMLRIAFASPARLAIAPLQDFLGLGSEARLNTPGTVGDNWQWQLDAPLDASQVERIGELVEAGGRSR